MHSDFIKVKDLTMHVRTGGANAPEGSPVVVLIHGLGVSSRYMMPTANHLVDFARVYAPDLPGFGLSEKPPQPFSVSELADYLLAWMDAANIERAAFVGNSFGAQIVVDLAVRYPQRVERAVLIALTVDPHARHALRQIARLLLDATREPFSMLPIAVGDYFRAGIRRAARTLRFALADPIEKKLPRMAAPVLLIRGGRDPIVPQRWTNEAAQLLPHARLEIIPHAAHAVNYNSPVELVSLLAPFLREPLK
ncbi:MAG: alpha/beta fold hydrolase [Pyrinomonadaceae bacterium]